MSFRTLVIGDVHGCLEELQELIEIFKPSQNDTVIFAGDLIHKGPFSAEVLSYVSILRHFCTVKVVAGNHEEKQLRFIANEARARLTGKSNPMQKVEGYAELANACDTDMLYVMESARLFVEAEDFVILHGGYGKHHCLEDVALRDLKTLASDERERAKWLLFTRYLTPKGFPVSLGKETKEDKFWAEMYDGEIGHILFGHQPFLTEEKKEFPFATGLDLGCVFGNKLCGVEISKGKIVNTIYVNAKRKYATSYFED